METLRERPIGEGREASQQQQRLPPPPEAFPITEYSQIQSQLQSQSSQPANSPFTSNPFGDGNTVAAPPTSLPRAGSLPPLPPPPTTLFTDLAHALAPPPSHPPSHSQSNTHADDHPVRERDDDDDADTDSLLAPPPEYQEHHQATSLSFVATGVEAEAVPPSYDAAGLPAGTRLEVGGALAAAEKEKHEPGLQSDQGSGLVQLQGRVLGTTSEIGTTDEKADLKKAEEHQRTFSHHHQQQHADYEPLHHPPNRTSNPPTMPHHQQRQDEEKNHLTDLYTIADALSRAYTSSPRLEAQRYTRSWSPRQESLRKESLRKESSASAFSSSVGRVSGGEEGANAGAGGDVEVARARARAAGSLSLSDTASLIVHSATATATTGHVGGGEKGKEKERERASDSSFGSGSGSEVVMLAGGRMTKEDEAELRMIWDQIERAHGYRLGEQSHTTDPTNEAERQGRQKEAFYRELLRKTGEGRFRSQDHSPVPVDVGSGTGTSNRVYDQTRGSDESLVLLNAAAAPSTSATVPAATASASAIEWHQSFARIHTPESQRSSPGIYNMLRTDGRDSGEQAAGPNLLPSGERRPSEEEMLSMQDFLEKEETLVTMQEFLRKGM